MSKILQRDLGLEKRKEKIKEVRTFLINYLRDN
jgi:hypothetical protein